MPGRPSNAGCGTARRDESVVTLSQLQGRILRDPHVMARLLDDLTISVSSMFRDPAFFAALRNVALPRLRTYPYRAHLECRLCSW